MRSADVIRLLWRLAPYLLAVATIAIASVVTAFTSGTVAVLIATYCVAVSASAWYGGLGPGVLATVLGYLVANWYFVPQADAFRPTAVAFVYGFVCLAIAVFGEISRRALQRARANAAQIKLIVESIADGFVVVDGSWRLVYTNRATEEFQQSHAQPGSAPSLADFPRTLSPRAQDMLKRAALNQTTVEFEEFYTPWQRWLEFKASPTEGAGLAMYFRDVTERKQAEDELHRLASIIECSEDAVIGVDLNETIISWNQAAEKMYGYTTSEILGQPIRRLLPPDLVDEESHILSTIRAGGVVRHFDTMRLTKSLRKIDVSLGVSAMRDAHGNLVGYSKIARDISDRVRAERALREADRRKDDFLALLGHELRNPLAGIVNGVEVLNQPGLAEGEAREVQAIIERQATHMTRLIDDLLDVSRIVRGKITLDIQRVDLTAVVRQAVADRVVTAEGNRPTVDIMTPSGEVWVEGDSVRLAQVVDNLVSNALKFSEPQGRVTVSVSTEPDSRLAKLEVRDSGIGMTPSTLATLFEPFAQARETLERSCGGLGLGLAVVKGLVELHRGRIEARSDGPGHGSSFIMRLPLSSAPVDASSPERAAPEANSDQLRVLVIDDNRDVLHLLSRLLTLGGHNVAVAKEGSPGVELARQFRPDLVLCDIGLPGEMNGYQVASALRADPLTRNAHLVAITGYGQAEDRRRALEAGFDRHVTKPLGHAELLNLIGELAKDGNQVA